MLVVRNIPLVLLALFIDGLQAAIAWGLSVVAAIPGTVGGGAAGCVVGERIAGTLGCWIGGLVFGILGTSLDPFLAPITIPIGIVVGFAINTTISIVFGAGLITVLLLAGVKPKRKLALGFGELIPGINNMPFWTALTIASLWADARKRVGTNNVPGTRMASFFGGGVSALGRHSETIIDRARTRGEREGLPIEASHHEKYLSRQRATLQDIRPSTSYSSKDNFRANALLPAAANDADKPYAQAS